MIIIGSSSLAQQNKFWQNNSVHASVHLCKICSWH